MNLVAFGAYSEHSLDAIRICLDLGWALSERDPGGP